MLFNSYEFIFYFLTPVIILYFSISKIYRIYYLILVSFIFYAQWDIGDFFILFISIVINYSFSTLISKRDRYQLVLLYSILLFNILLLGYFKYFGFLNLSNSDTILPLAISFFTFQQIAYIVDIYKGNIKIESFNRYLFFISFFPQLIAGPIMHYNDITKQIKHKEWGNFNLNQLKAGITLFSIGLFKKVVLADNLVSIVDDSFNHINLAMSSFDAWMGLFAFSFMIYFDFSGYADMAIGLALLFGIHLNLNFYSPYKAVNLIEFWRRWHITLSIFLRDHIYIPLGGNRSGKTVQIFSLMFTMLVGGIWHGAGWNFLIWGGVHGLGLALLHILYQVKRVYFYNLKENYLTIFFKYISILITFLFVTLLWVLFRTDNISDALTYYLVLKDFNFSSAVINLDSYLIVTSLLIVWILPNSMQVVKLNQKDFGLKSWYGYMSAILLFIALKLMAESPSVSFVYFNF